jgi:hypothetical protein
MTMRLIVLTAVATVLAAAPASAAGPVPLLASRTVQDIAVAGPDVIVSRAGPLGTVRVDALPTGGGPARPLLSTAPRGDEWDVFTTVAASPQRVAAVAVFVSPAGEISGRLYTGPPRGPLTLEPRDGVPFDVAVDGDRVLVVNGSEQVDQLRLLAPGAAVRRVQLTDPLTGFFAFAGERVAFGSEERLVLVDLATGSRVLSVRADDFAHLDVAANGTIIADGDDIGVFTVMPSGLRQGVPDGEFLTNPRFAGRAIAAIEESRFEAGRPVVLPPGAIHPRPIGLPSATIEDIDADARGVAWIAHGCVQYATVDAVAPAEPPAGPCARAEVDVHNASFTSRGRTIRLVAQCIAAPAAGCNGTVAVRGHGIRGRGSFHSEPGRERRFSVRFTRRSVRRIRHEVRRDDGAFLSMTTRLTDGGPPDREGAVFVSAVR